MLPAPETSELDRLRPALEQIGAELVTHDTIIQSNENTQRMIFQWRDRLIRLTNNFADGLTCYIGPAGVPEPSENDWKTIFSYTVKDFDQFDRNQKIAWIVSVPKGTAYPDFLASHILHLPSVIP